MRNVASRLKKLVFSTAKIYCTFIKAVVSGGFQVSSCGSRRKVYNITSRIPVERFVLITTFSQWFRTLLLPTLGVIAAAQNRCKRVLKQLAMRYAIYRTRGARSLPRFLYSSSGVQLRTEHTSQCWLQRNIPILLVGLQLSMKALCG